MIGGYNNEIFAVGGEDNNSVDDDGTFNTIKYRFSNN